MSELTREQALDRAEVLLDELECLSAVFGTADGQEFSKAATRKWRLMARALLPDLYWDFVRGSVRGLGSVYHFFFALGPAAHRALEHDDEVELAKIFAFSQWCLKSSEKELWNAAAVSFYEHIYSGDELHDQRVHPWISEADLDEVRGLVAAMRGDEFLAAIRDHHAKRQRDMSDLIEEVKTVAAASVSSRFGMH